MQDNKICQTVIKDVDGFEKALNEIFNTNTEQSNKQEEEEEIQLIGVKELKKLKFKEYKQDNSKDEDYNETYQDQHQEYDQDIQFDKQMIEDLEQIEFHTESQLKDIISKQQEQERISQYTEMFQENKQSQQNAQNVEGYNEFSRNVYWNMETKLYDLSDQDL